MAQIEIKELVEQIRLLMESGDEVSLRQLLSEQRNSDLAEVVGYLGARDGAAIIKLLPVPDAAEVFEKVLEATRYQLFDILEDDHLRSLICELDLDDAADILGELPKEDTEELLSLMEPADSAKIKHLMQYSEDSAGGIMDPVVLSLRAEQTAEEALKSIREYDIEEDFFAIFVTDNRRKYLGSVRFRSLIAAHPQTRLKELIEHDDFYVRVDQDQEEVRNIFSRNELIVVPVVDYEHRLVGRITADRVIEVAEEEAAEDIYAMAGTDALEHEFPSVFNAARVRMTWLLPCMVGTGVTALVMLLFQKSFSSVYAVAAAFAPMIGAISGNAGLQTSAVVVCGLATGHFAANKLGQVFARETRIAGLVALSCGVIGGIIYSILSDVVGHNIPDGIGILKISTAFSISMFLAIMVSTTLGLSLPFLFKKIGIDPAISSGPLVTTANDSISVSIYMVTTLVFMG